MKKTLAVSILLVMALLLPTLPVPARAALPADAASAYLEVLTAQRASIPVEPWMALRGESGFSDKTENLKSVSLVDLDTDGIPELVFLTAKDNDGIFGKHVILNVYAFSGGVAKLLCAEEISYGGGTQPHFFKVYRLEGSSDLLACGGWWHAQGGGGNYYRFSLKDGGVTRQILRKTEKYDPARSAVAYTYQLNGNAISEDEYLSTANEMSGPIADVLVDSGSGNSGQSGMVYSDAVALLSDGAVRNSIGVSVNGIPVRWTDAMPFIDENNRTLVPLRAVAEALDLSVSWDGARREASFGNGAKTIVFPIGSSVARTGDGGTVEMDTAAVIVNDRTYAPVRYLAEFFGYAVSWDAASRTVLIQRTAGLEKATVTMTRMNHSYWGSGEMAGIFVNCYYDLASITDDTPLRDKINASLRSDYEAFQVNSGSGPAHAGGYDEGTINYMNAREGEVVQNADGILSLRYVTHWMMGGVGDGSPFGITVSLKTGELLRLSDLRPIDGSSITLRAMEDVVKAEWRLDDVDLGVKTIDDLAFYIEDNQVILCIWKYQLGYAALGEFPTGIYIRT